MPIPRRWSSHSQAKGDWRMDPEGQWVIWADVAEVIEWATPQLVLNHSADGPRTRLLHDLAAYIHGSDCTCPYSIEPADIEKAEAVLASFDRLDAEELHPSAEWNVGGMS